MGNCLRLELMSKVKTLHFPPSSCQAISQHAWCLLDCALLTLLVALLSVQIESSTGTRSASTYPAKGPFAMAEATADLKNSIDRYRVCCAHKLLRPYGQSSVEHC